MVDSKSEIQDKHHPNRGNRKKRKKRSKRKQKHEGQLPHEVLGSRKFLLTIGSILLACKETQGYGTNGTSNGGHSAGSIYKVVVNNNNDNHHRHHQDGKAPRSHNCDLYLAPSKIGGWGVYAARDFAESEIIEIIPRFIVLKHDWYQQNVLDDYHYTYLWMSNPEESSYGVVVFGHGSFYNHAAENNVMFTHFGHEPTAEFPMYAPALGYTALRDIKRGEELLASYGDTDEWFTARGLEMLPPAPPHDFSLEEIEAREQMYCSKVYAGYGTPTWEQRVLPTQRQVDASRVPVLDQESRMAMNDHPTAVAKQFVPADQVLEIAPALVLPIDQVQNSPFAPMGIYWHDWDTQQKEALERLREASAWRVKGRDKDGYMSWDVLNYYDDAVVVPVAGNLGMVRKVGRHRNANSNCRMEIVQASSDLENADIGSAGLVLKLIATRDIQAGEELRLNLADRSTWFERKSLLQNLALTGQPIPPYLTEDPTSNSKQSHQAHSDDTSTTSRSSSGEDEL